MEVGKVDARLMFRKVSRRTGLLGCNSHGNLLPTVRWGAPQKVICAEQTLPKELLGGLYS